MIRKLLCVCKIRLVIRWCIACVVAFHTCTLHSNHSELLSNRDKIFEDSVFFLIDVGHVLPGTCAARMSVWKVRSMFNTRQTKNILPLTFCIMPVHLHSMHILAPPSLLPMLVESLLYSKSRRPKQLQFPSSFRGVACFCDWLFLQSRPIASADARVQNYCLRGICIEILLSFGLLDRHQSTDVPVTLGTKE